MGINRIGHAHDAVEADRFCVNEVVDCEFL
jgi:hypothetical protein